MSTQPIDNTLHIRPIPPANTPDGPADQTSARTTDPAPHLARDHDAAEAARAKIAALPDVHQDRTNSLLQQLNTPILELTQTSAVAGLTPARETPAAEAKADPQTHKPRTSRRLPSRVKPILTALGSFVLLLVLFKSQVIISQIKYLTAKTNPVVTVAPNPTAGEVVDAASVINIPKINVSAPVVYEPSNVEASVQKALEGGVVHYANTAVPGQAGNNVIVGHSSNDWWEPGNYKFVFVLLDKLVTGDTLSVNYQSKKYVYQVTEVKVVEPTDVSVLAPTPEPTLTLITCTPPGTSWKRLIVRAKQISPTSQVSQPAAAGQPKTNQSLPGSAPTWWDQIQSMWQRLLGQPGTTTTDTPSTTKAPATAPTGAPSLPGAK